MVPSLLVSVNSTGSPSKDPKLGVVKTVPDLIFVAVLGKVNFK